MRVRKSQIVNGITEYISDEILPKMGDDRTVQIMITIAMNALKANGKMVDAVLSNGIVAALLEDDGSGTYDIGPAAEAMREAVDQYGYFEVVIPAVPLISPHEIKLALRAADVDAIRRRIETTI